MTEQIDRATLRRALCAFQVHRRGARRRGIEFLFSFIEWWDWWQTDGRWSRRGHGADNLCMCRNGDKGPYSPDNVYCATRKQNSEDKDRALCRAAALVREARRKELGIPSHLTDREHHPRARIVVTPAGTYPSAALAAEAHGITKQGAAYRAARGVEGWRWE